MTSARRNPTIDDLLNFNKQLIQLHDAGVSIEPGNGVPSETMVQRLEQISSRLALQVSRGQSLDQAIAFDINIPAAYKTACETWFHGEQPLEALNSLTSQAEARREMQISFGNSLIQPLIILGLVYLGFIYLALFAAPNLQAAYEQMHAQPSPSLRFLLAVRNWILVWAPLIPLLIIALSIYWFRGSSSWSYGWLPGQRRFVQSANKANYAENVARLVQSKISVGESLQLVGPMAGSDVSAQAFQIATASLLAAERAETTQIVEGKLQGLPALLSWACTAGTGDSTRSEMLRFAASAYRENADRERVRWRTWLPLVAGVVLGGVMVLVYALSLFAPIIELLLRLTRQ